MFGLIEGFYGPPWSWTFRIELAAKLHSAGFDTYIYAPKDDPLHRDHWREPYTASDLAEFARFAAQNTLRLGVAISPGLSIDYDSHNDRVELRDKYTSLIDSGATVIGLLLDDIDPFDGAGAAHGSLAAWLRDQIASEVEMFFVPLHYTGIHASRYLKDIDERVPLEVPIAWTGRFVVNRTITAQDAQAWSGLMSGRKPLLWDNTPVNDAMMERHLFTGPLSGRDSDLPQHLSGYLANPMVQGPPSVAPLISAAAWWNSEDPYAAWHESLVSNRNDLRFMEAASIEIATAYCDAAIGLDNQSESIEGLSKLQLWLEEVLTAVDSGVDESVSAWGDAVRIEANTALLCVHLLRSNDNDFKRDVITVLATALSAPPTKYALGAPAHLQPRMFHDENSDWRLSSEAFEDSTRVSDRLLGAVQRRAVRLNA